jgi:hypothetical protein
MAFGFKGLEDYFKKTEKAKQPVGTSVNPLGKFAPKMIQQDVYQPVNYPTPLIEAWNFFPDHPAKEGIGAEQGPEILGRNKAFNIPGDDHKGREKAFSIEGQAHSTKDKKPFDFTPKWITQQPRTPEAGKEFSTEPPRPRPGVKDYPTQEPLKPRAGAPEYPTQEPLKPRAGAPEYTTQTTTPRPGAPEYSTQAITPRPGAPEYSTQEPVKTQYFQTHKLDKLSPSSEGAMLELIVNKQYKDRLELFAADTKDKINHLNNNQSKYVGISGDPGNMMFKMKFDQTPAGGSSIWTHTRLGGPTSMGVQARKYMDKFARVRDVSDSVSPQEINYDGNSVPAAAIMKRTNVLSDDALVKGLYEKVGKNDFKSLRDEAKRNNPRAPLWQQSPFIQRGIQRGPGNKNPNSPGFLPDVDPINGSIGMITAPLIDTIRVGSYLISPDGLLFMAKQVGLQLTNPRSEWKIGLHRGRIFNPLSFALQVPANALGIHIDRHYLGPLNAEGSKYEKLVSDLDKEGETLDSSKNRLVKLLDEMSTGILGVGKTPGSKIDLLSGIMGPKSLFGIGRTRHHKHTSGIDVFFGQDALTATYEPETPYSKNHASGEWSEAMKGDETDIKMYSETSLDNGQTIVAREEDDTYWSDKAAEHSHPRILAPIDLKGEVGGFYYTMDYADITDFRNKKMAFRDYRARYANTPMGMGIRDFENAYDQEGRINIVKRLKLTDYGATLPGYSEPDLFEDADNDNEYVRVQITGEPKKDEELKIRVRAYNLEITDKLSPSYTEYGYAGNPASSHIFEKIGRDWSMKFTLAAFHSEELIANYKKLNGLMRLASPKIIAGYAGGQINKVTCGHLWREVPCIIDTCEYAINNDGGWDIGHGFDKGWDDGAGNAETVKFELPMLLDVTLGGKFLTNSDGNIWSSEGAFFPQAVLDKEFPPPENTEE